MEERKNSAARIRANNKYAAKAYDRINIAVPKGRKDVIQEYAQQRGESINAFIGRAITEAMERDGGGAATPEAVQQETGTAPAGRVVYRVPAGIASEIAQEGQEGPSESWAGILTPSTLQAAQEAAEAAGETLPDFVTRAVTMQAQMDRGQRERTAAAGTTRSIPQLKADFVTLPAVGVPVPPDRIEQAAKDNMSGICSLINEGERRAGNKGRSKQSLSEEFALRDLFKAGYTVEEVRAAAEKAAQEGYTGSWYVFPKYCAKLYGRRWRDPR